MIAYMIGLILSFIAAVFILYVAFHIIIAAGAAVVLPFYYLAQGACRTWGAIERRVKKRRPPSFDRL